MFALLTQQNSVRFSVADKVRASQVFVFRLLLHNPNDLGKVLAMAERIGLALGTDSPRIVRQQSVVEVQIPLSSDLHRVLTLHSIKDRRDGLWVTLGQTPAGKNVNVDLSSPNYCHALIAGTSGSGKTVAQNLVAWSLAMGNSPDDVMLLLIDGKGGVDWWGFREVAHLGHAVIGEPSEAVGALTWVVKEIGERGSSGQIEPRIFVVVDEVYKLLEAKGDVIARLIQQITALGRSVGVHLIAATQYPLVDAIGGGLVKANLPFRLTGRVLNSQHANIATGVKNSGAEKLLGRGDCLVNGEHRVQVALIQNRDFGLLPRRHNGVPQIDFASLDPDRVLSVAAGNGGNRDSVYTEPIVRSSNIPDPFEPEQVAWAVANGAGIGTLKRRFGIGSTKATRLRQFAAEMLVEWQRIGYEVRPTVPA